MASAFYSRSDGLDGRSTMCGLEDIIKVGLIEVGWEDAHWLQEDADQWGILIS